MSRAHVSQSLDWPAPLAPSQPQWAHPHQLVEASQPSSQAKVHLHQPCLIGTRPRWDQSYMPNVELEGSFLSQLVWLTPFLLMSTFSIVTTSHQLTSPPKNLEYLFPLAGELPTSWFLHLAWAGPSSCPSTILANLITTITHLQPFPFTIFPLKLQYSCQLWKPLFFCKISFIFIILCCQTYNRYLLSPNCAVNWNKLHLPSANLRIAIPK